MKKYVFVAVCLLTTFIVNAQRYEFGRVSEDEISRTVHHLDPEAPAAILYKKGRVTFQYQEGWLYNYEVEGRIKIYNQDGFDFATIIIPLLRAGSGQNEKFTDFRGFTHNIENGKAVRERLRSSDIFDEDVNEFWDLKKITFPNIKEGSVIEYSYMITSPFIRALPNFEFQDQIPVNFAEYTTVIPEWLGYKIYTKGFLDIAHDRSVLTGQLTVSYRSSNPHYNLRSVSTSHSTLNLNFVSNTYSVNDAPKIVQEEYMNNFKNYTASIQPELQWERIPNNPIKNYSSTWEDITRNIYNSRSFGNELAASNYFESELNNILKNVNSDKEKAIKIFEYVKNRMTWNGMYGYYSQNGLRRAHNNKQGNVGDINLLLVSMMRYANLDASPVLISSIGNGIPFFPTVTGFNYVACGVRLNNELTLFDATSMYSAPNVLPERTLNWVGRLIKNENHSQSIKLMPSTPSRQVVNMQIDIRPNASIEGKYRVSLTDHFALRYRNNHATKSESIYIDELEKRFGDIEISEYSIQNKTHVYEPVIESFSFIKNNALDQIGDKLYVSPLFLETMSRNPFTAETRSYPIDFTVKSSISTNVTINIPEGYKVEFIPESRVFQLPDQIGEFRYLISHNGSAIQLRVIREINVNILSDDYYQQIKAFYGDIISKQAEKIILSKI